MTQMMWRSVVELQDVGAEVIAAESFLEAAEVVDESDIVGAAAAAGFEDVVRNDVAMVEDRRSQRRDIAKIARLNRMVCSRT